MVFIGWTQSLKFIIIGCFLRIFDIIEHQQAIISQARAIIGRQQAQISDASDMITRQLADISDANDMIKDVQADIAKLRAALVQMEDLVKET